MLHDTASTLEPVKVPEQPTCTKCCFSTCENLKYHIEKAMGIVTTYLEGETEPNLTDQNQACQTEEPSKITYLDEPEVLHDASMILETVFDSLHPANMVWAFKAPHILQLMNRGIVISTVHIDVAIRDICVHLATGEMIGISNDTSVRRINTINGQSTTLFTLTPEPKTMMWLMCVAIAPKNLMVLGLSTGNEGIVWRAIMPQYKNYVQTYTYSGEMVNTHNMDQYSVTPENIMVTQQTGIIAVKCSTIGYKKTHMYLALDQDLNLLYTYKPAQSPSMAIVSQTHLLVLERNEKIIVMDTQTGNKQHVVHHDDLGHVIKIGLSCDEGYLWIFCQHGKETPVLNLVKYAEIL